MLTTTPSTLFRSFFVRYKFGTLYKGFSELHDLLPFRFRAAFVAENHENHRYNCINLILQMHKIRSELPIFWRTVQ